MSKVKPIPTFKTEAEERKFWETHDSTDYIDWSEAERALSNPQAFNDRDFNSLAARLAGANQDRRQQTRRALSIADQNVARGESRVIPAFTASASCT
jgi:hypothetical protein